MRSSPSPPSGGSDAVLSGLRGDEHLVRDAAGWERFAEFAMAAAAFPGGFPARRLSRPTADYDWRGVVLPGGEGGQSSRHRARGRPAWEALDPPVRRDLPFSFDGVDGGAVDNRTVELVRTALSGLGGSNPRDPKEAHTTVLLLDPLAAVPRCDPPPAGPCDLLGVLGGLAAAWTDRGRVSAADLLLALEPSVFSRFLLTARREREGKPRHGAAALATAGMGGFLGFLHRDLRIHDYMMGRENCRLFPHARIRPARGQSGVPRLRLAPSGGGGGVPSASRAARMAADRARRGAPARAAAAPGLAAPGAGPREPCRARAGTFRAAAAPLARPPWAGHSAEGGGWIAARKLAGAAEAEIRKAMASGGLG